MIQFVKNWWVMSVLVAAFVSLAVFETQAINEGFFPRTILDVNCTDANDTPAAAGQVGARPQPQTTGPLDGFCDHDSRIEQAAITTDTDFGPFKLPPGTRNLLLFIDADDVLPGPTNTWQYVIRAAKPHDATKTIVAVQGSQGAEGDVRISFGSKEYAAIAQAGVTNIDCSIPISFFIQLDLITATSWDGSLSWYAY